jgi:cytochrome b561
MSRFLFVYKFYNVNITQERYTLFTTYALTVFYVTFPRLCVTSHRKTKTYKKIHPHAFRVLADVAYVTLYVIHLL